MAQIDPTARFLEPRGFGLAILIVNLVCLTTAVLFVGIRTCIRLYDMKFLIDDTFMVIGTIIYMAQVGVSSWSCFTGLGSPDSQHNALMLSETKHAYVIWALVYNFALAFIKTSICLTLIRIFAYQTKYIYTSVFSLIGITWMGYLVSLMGTLLDCRPISAAWDEKGKCSNRFTFASLTYTVTATALFTDMSIVVLTAIVLWRTMMPWSTKIQVFGFMSFASLASVFLIIRSIYISHFAGRTNIDTSNLGTINAAIWMGHISLFSNLENGAGCILSSLPAVRRLFGRNKPELSPPDVNRNNRSFFKGMKPVDFPTTVNLQTMNNTDDSQDLESTKCRVLEQEVKAPAVAVEPYSSRKSSLQSHRLGSSYPI